LSYRGNGRLGTADVVREVTRQVVAAVDELAPHEETHPEVQAYGPP
jgi:hypothetical protein